MSKSHTPKSRQKPAAPSCATCRYLLSRDDDTGDCRRMPPQLVMTAQGMSGAFPGVRKSDIWCGEWKPNPVKS